MGKGRGDPRWTEGAYQLVANREAPSAVLGVFQLIDHRNGKVLHGDAALTLGIDYKISAPSRKLPVRSPGSK